MIAFLILIIWTIVSYDLCKKVNSGNVNKIYCWNMFFATLLLQGFRSIYIGGVDTSLVYASGFEKALNTSFNNMSVVFKKDILFHYLTKCFTFICTDFHVYIFAISAFVLGSFCTFVYRHSDRPVFSYIIYYALGYYAIGFQMLRHVMALSILLFAYDFILERKWMKFIAIVLLASCFHSSALIFLIAYPLSRMKIGYKQWIAIVATVVSVFFARGKIAGIINRLISGMDRYSRYSENVTRLSLTGAFILICIYIAAFVFAYPAYKKNDELKVLLNLSVISIAFMTLVTVVGEFHRISMFFGIYNTVLLPKAWKKYQARDSRLKVVYLLGINTVLIAYFLLYGLSNYSLSAYRFFWMD